MKEENPRVRGVWNVTPRDLAVVAFHFAVCATKPVIYDFIHNDDRFIRA